jgi:hypothetical protein
VPTHAAAAFLILGAILTGIIAGFATRELASTTGGRSYDIPAALPPRPISAGWHPRYDADLEHRRLRSQVQDIASELAGTAASKARVQSR